MSFVNETRSHFDQLSESLFADLKAGEDLVLNLAAEDSLFVRFNGNQVRQNTGVEQRTLSLQFQSSGRTVVRSKSLTGRMDADRLDFVKLVEACRAEARALPEDPNQVAVANHGTSSESFAGTLLPMEQIADAVALTAVGSDLAALYAGGPAIRANRNSKGQSHWFDTENFFLDYSLYNGPKAAKNCYAGAIWDRDAWQGNLNRTRESLALLARPVQTVKPGKYKTYLAPSAFHDLVSMCSWGALSGAAWKQGHSAFKKLADGEVKLSNRFSLSEHFALGLTPRFNGLGEVAPAEVKLIESGALKELLVSSRTAKEFGLKSNSAIETESLRAMDVAAGSLQESDVLKQLGTGLYLSNLHYLNWSDPVSARITGMTRYACFWVEGGAIAGPIQDLRWDESLYDALGSKLMALTSHTEIHPSTDTYFVRSLGGSRTPGALIDQFTFTL